MAKSASAASCAPDICRLRKVWHIAHRANSRPANVVRTYVNMLGWRDSEIGFSYSVQEQLILSDEIKVNHKASWRTCLFSAQHNFGSMTLGITSIPIQEDQEFV